MRINPEEQYTFDQTHKSGEIPGLLEGVARGERGEPFIATGGRLLAIRDMGRICFGDLHDEEGSVQVIADADTTPDYEDFTSLNVGDWVGVTGNPGLSKRGEPSIYATDWARLAKTDHPFPDKKNGLQDPDIIARQRYLDIAVNPESMERFLNRSKIVSEIRRDLGEQGFVEVETPILQPLYGGATAKPFETHHNALNMELYLRIAPELYLKRLVAGGIQRVFEIGKVFRNEGVSTRHNPEFSMMEVYAAFWDYEGQMKLTENMVANLAEKLHGTTQLEYQGKELDLSAPWERRTMDSLVSEALGEEVTIDVGVEKLRRLCEEHEISYEEGYGSGKLLLELYEKLVESGLWGPIFVTDYPQEVSPLARAHRSRPGYTERFEGIVGGRELCNGYTELNDPREQYLRFIDEEAAQEYDDEAMPIDHDYIRALQYGLPPTAGMGIGIERLAMILTDTATIKDVVLFPTQRPDNFIVSYDKE